MPPRLKFFTELEIENLAALLESETVIQQIKRLGASIAIGLLDLSPERAAVVQHLNQSGVPVTAWLLLPRQNGYWFNIDNASEACAYYEGFRNWQEQYHLKFEAIGIDIEPDIHDMQNLIHHPLRLLPVFMWRALDRKRLLSARKTYRHLVGRMRTDGFFVESYQFPLIVDERLVRSSLLQRMLGIFDVTVDREVLMLYSSYFRPNGVGILWSYAAEAGGIGIGSTGGGIDSELGKFHWQPLTWDEFARDLRISWYWTDALYIFSLEGCCQQGFLERLETFHWDDPIIAPLSMVEKIERVRRIIQLILWISAHLPGILLAFTGFWILLKKIEQWFFKPKQFR